MKRITGGITLVLAIGLTYLLVEGWVRERRVAAFDEAAIVAVWQLQPRLASLSGSLSSPTLPRGECTSPLPATFPVCERDGAKVLLLHAASPDADDLHPIHGLLYDPAQENAEFAGRWYVGHLLEPLGHGWYHVRAYPGLD